MQVDPREKRLVWAMFASVLLVGFALSCIPVGPILYVPIALNGVAWTIVGFLLTAVAVWKGARGSGAVADGESSRRF